jgi:hypothetical protein
MVSLCIYNFLYLPPSTSIYPLFHSFLYFPFFSPFYFVFFNFFRSRFASAVHNFASLNPWTQYSTNIKYQAALWNRNSEFCPQSAVMCSPLFPHVPYDYHMFHMISACFTLPACSIRLSHVPHDFRMFHTIPACSIRLSHVPHDFRMFHTIITCSTWFPHVSHYSRVFHTIITCSTWFPHVSHYSRLFHTIIICSIQFPHVPYDSCMFHTIITCSIQYEHPGLWTLSRPWTNSMPESDVTSLPLVVPPRDLSLFQFFKILMNSIISHVD